MYKIIKENQSFALTEAPTYIKRAENGSFVLCPEEEATGIAHEGVPYHLLGRATLDGVESVMLLPMDGGAEVQKASEAGGITFVTLAEAGQIDAVTAGEHAELFTEWAWPVGYKKDQIRRYNEELYRCLTAHTSQKTWTPPDAPSLWVRIADPQEEWPEWSQPVGAMDAYQAGAQVSHNGRHWISELDNNVWEPGVYGWKEAENV